MNVRSTIIVLALAGALSACSEVGTAGRSPVTQENEAATVSSFPSRTRITPAAKTPKQECEVLLNAMLPAAEKQLGQRRRFSPFGGAILSNGQLVFSGGQPGGVRAPSADWGPILERGYQAGAKAGRYRATSIVSDVMITPPGRDENMHAISFRLDHRDGYSVVVFYPYALGDSGSLAIERPFSIEGARTIFP